MSLILVRGLSPEEKRRNRRLVLMLMVGALLSYLLARLVGDVPRCLRDPVDLGDFAAVLFVAVACGCVGGMFHVLQRFLDDAQARGVYQTGGHYAGWCTYIAILADLTAVGMLGGLICLVVR